MNTNANNDYSLQPPSFREETTCSTSSSATYFKSTDNKTAYTKSAEDLLPTYSRNQELSKSSSRECEIKNNPRSVPPERSDFRHKTGTGTNKYFLDREALYNKTVYVNSAHFKPGQRSFRRRIQNVCSMAVLFRSIFILFVLIVVLSYYSLSNSGAENCAVTNSCPNIAAYSEDGIHNQMFSRIANNPYQNEISNSAKSDVLHLGVVACGERLEETLIMLKSAVTFGNSSLHAHIFCDDDIRPMFAKSLVEWQKLIKWREFKFSLYKITFPAGKEEQWRKLFKPCACQRLFIPELLTSVDSLIYVDTDILFMRSVDSLWRHFSRFNSSHIAGLAWESEDRTANWYIRFARHPFYPPLGVNSGVMLMNLKKMREFNWSSYLWPLYTKYRYNLTWGDQDIINIIFHDNPDHCMYMSTCKKAEELGAFVIHGSRSYFHLDDKQPAFKAIYQAWKKYELGSDVKKNLMEPLEESLDEVKKTLTSGKGGNCARVAPIYTKILKKYVAKHGSVPGKEV